MAMGAACTTYGNCNACTRLATSKLHPQLHSISAWGALNYLFHGQVHYSPLSPRKRHSVDQN
jgi:hypothetical protein